MLQSSRDGCESTRHEICLGAARRFVSAEGTSAYGGLGACPPPWKFLTLRNAVSSVSQAGLEFTQVLVIK